MRLSMSDLTATSQPVSEKTYPKFQQKWMPFGALHMLVLPNGMKMQFNSRSLNIAVYWEGKYVASFNRNKLWFAGVTPAEVREKVKLVFDKLEDDPLKTISEFGLECGRCCVCGLALTNEVSKKLGIGPICRKSLS